MAADRFSVAVHRVRRWVALTGEIDIAAAAAVADALDSVIEELPEVTAVVPAMGDPAWPAVGTGRAGPALLAGLRESHRPVPDDGLVRLRVDLHTVTFIDSSGLTPLLRAAAYLDRRYARLHLVDPSRCVRRLLGTLHNASRSDVPSTTRGIRPGRAAPGLLAPPTLSPGRAPTTGRAA